MKHESVVCSCGVRTTKPFMVRGALLCVSCAEEVAPRMVARMVRNDERRYRESARNDREMRRWDITW